MDPKYKGCRMSAQDAQREAHKIAFAPIVFQVSRLMVKYGIFGMLEEAGRKTPAGMTVEEISEKTGLSVYAVSVLLESSLTAGTIFLNNKRFTISKIGWFLLNDPMVRADIDFNHDVNYKGLFHLDEALREGRPAGLKELGDWPTLYEGLSSLPEQVQKSWFGFDHFYSDNSFEQAMPLVFGDNVRSVLDIGGNTGRFALKCVEKYPEVNVTVMDLPQQIGLLQNNISGKPGAGRIHTYPGDLLKEDTEIPGGFDVVWMSQFLDCFSEEEILSILRRAAEVLRPGARLCIMELLWNRQRFETAAFCLTMTSLYFTAMANGNSKMYYSEDLTRLIEKAGMKVGKIIDGIGQGHNILICAKE